MSTDDRHVSERWRGTALLAAMLCAAGCGDTRTSVGVDGWQISVSAPAIVGTTVSGSFTAEGEGLRAFGACLLADLHGGKVCASDADCSTGSVVPFATGHHEYCLKLEGAAESTCWTRNAPDVAWCNKVPPPGRAAGDYSTPTVDAAAIAGSGRETRWITLACLNAGTYPMFSGGPLPPCATSDPAAASYKAYAPSAVSTYTAP